MLRRSAAILPAAVLLSCGAKDQGAAAAKPPATQQQQQQLQEPSRAQQHTLDELNRYRAEAGVAPLSLDAALTSFADAGNRELAAGGDWHAHFQRAGDDLFNQGFGRQAAENQGKWSGEGEAALIDRVLKSMMDEGPGGGHYDTILRADLSRVGVAVGLADGSLALTNDFSASCSANAARRGNP